MSVQNEEIVESVRKGLAAWESKDVATAVALGADIKGGFGWRNYAWRDQPYRAEMVAGFLDNLEYYGVELNDIHAWSEGEIGIAWGTFTESFKHKGQPPEKVRVRFTSTHKKDSRGWHDIMYHRDIQPFNENGKYPIELTQVK